MAAETTDDVATSATETTLYAGVELSRSSWMTALHCPTDGGKISYYTGPAGDVDNLLEVIARRRGRVARDLGSCDRVLLTSEAGYEGFWLARAIERRDVGISVFLNDPASLQVDRRSKNVKTDRVGGKKMVRALKAWDLGDNDAMSWVRVPEVSEEDARRLLRERDVLMKEKQRHGNRIRSALMLHGIFDVSPYKSDFLVKLESVQTGYGEALPPRQHDEIRREIARLHLLQDQIAELEIQKKELVAMGKAALEQAAPRVPSIMAAVATEAAAAAERADQAVAEVLEPDGGQEPIKDGLGTCSGENSASATLTSLKGIGENDAILLGSDVFPKAVDGATPPENPVVAEVPGQDGAQKSIEGLSGYSGCGAAIARMAATLTSLKGIGENDAILLSGEVFSRDFANRRQIGSWAGLTSVPWQSGRVDHEQGISKAGPGRVRKHLIQMSWRWLRFQPGSDLALWYQNRMTAVASASERLKKRAKKRNIVALARKLLIALWRFATQGLVPVGATGS